MGYEYTAEIKEQQARAFAIVRELIDDSAVLELASEKVATLNAIYPVRSGRDGKWPEDVSLYFLPTS